MRRLAWDAPEVNEEWNCDKGRFAFPYTNEGRLTHPLVRDDAGKLVAVSYQYACHSTSISPNENKISGDWGGISAGIIESKNPGCIALPIIGCGADANPNPRGTIELSRKHGAEMAESVQTVLGHELKPLPQPYNAAFMLVALARERPN
jgi:hypothetical protein